MHIFFYLFMWNHSNQQPRSIVKLRVRVKDFSDDFFGVAANCVATNARISCSDFSTH
ncbi:hypothetical protein HanRHA438_Chr01g0020261 [Helianthus annuus]|nr:hypothetical protein HanIR_Chr01g0021501 [Helianthus annuus]KAJ0947815.1 hypothetical protein HanRHA438_Chr01g0020261 [Helianthus annuus]